MSTRRILVAIDGSNPSFKASNYAIDLAKRYNTELIVLFILSPVPYSQFVYDNIGSTKEIETIEKEKAQQGAQKEVDKVKQKAREKKVSLKTELLVKYTSVTREIVKYAQEMNVDMIVIGSRGLTGFKKLLLGSVASGVVTYSHCPVLVVK